jgi:hypothetical protein
MVQSERLFVALRKDGPSGAAGRKPMYHAVTPFCRIALCTTEPGAASGWAEPPSDSVTCRACLEKLRRLNAGVGSPRAGAATTRWGANG